MTADTPEVILRDVLAILTDLGIAHMVVGSFASTLHGEPRTTRDLDLVIDPTTEQLDALLVRLDPDSYYVDADVAREALRRRSMFNVIDMASGWKLDLIVRKTRPFSIEELERRRRVSILGVEIDVATAEDTIIAKLEWARDGGSQRQVEDVAGILRVCGGTLELAYVDRWVTELGLEDVWRRARALAEP